VINPWLESAAQELQVKVGALSEFSTEDAFNPGNTLEGFVCHQSDHRYGALVIHTVNGEPVGDQVVYCTPKLRYPFDRVADDGERRYRFPKFVKAALWEKLDGTNILAYRYYDRGGQPFTTYKTRLTPVVKNSRFGSFVDLWREAMAAHPEIGERSTEGTAWSYELYGYRNHHLVRYPVALDARLLFTVDQQTASVLPPTQHGVQPVYTCTSGQDLKAVYEDMRAQAQEKNTKAEEDGQDVVYGSEGYVMYVLTTEGKWEMFKIKPEMIEASHWATGSIPESIILPTVRNAFESSDGSPDAVRQLLLEEFSQEQVSKSEARVHRCIRKVSEFLALRETVLSVFTSLDTPWCLANKGKVMRGLSSKVDRSKMRQAYGVLVREYGVPA